MHHQSSFWSKTRWCRTPGIYNKYPDRGNQDSPRTCRSGACCMHRQFLGPDDLNNDPISISPGGAILFLDRINRILKIFNLSTFQMKVLNGHPSSMELGSSFKSLPFFQTGFLPYALSSGLYARYYFCKRFKNT